MEHLLDFFIPDSYQISLFINKHKKLLSGQETIVGKTTSAGLLKLHAVGLSVSDLIINGESTDFTLENGLLTAPAPASSPVTVSLRWDGSLNENMQGAYLSRYRLSPELKEEELIVSTQFESHYAREAFPCIDEPAAKATFELSISIPDAEDIVLSNMPGQTEVYLETTERGAVSLRASACSSKNKVREANVLSSECPQATGRGSRRRSPVTTGAKDAGSDKESSAVIADQCYTWHFEKTPRMSTYLLAFVIGRFNIVEGKTNSGITVRTLAPLNQDKSLLSFPNSVAVRSLDFYEDLFKTPYPLKKLDQVAIPDFEAGAMENWGLVTYRSSQLLAAPSSPLDSKKSVALTITHELSHQWFGNLVTMSWWNDLWLNESFATIMEYFCTDALFPDYQVWMDFFTSDCLAALSRDAISGVQAVREDVSDPAEIATLFDPCIVYAKGARLMLMLLREMGETAFFSGLKDYFKKHAYKNTTASDLWRALTPHASFNVEEFMTPWLTQPGYPVITDEAQQRFLLDGSTDSSHYPVLEVKDDMSGHYLINLSGPEFSEALENFPALSEEQRLRLLIDRLMLSQTPIVSSSSLLKILPKFREETSAPVWDLLNTLISRISFFLEPGSTEDIRFRAYLGNLVAPLLKPLGLTRKPNETTNDTALRSTLSSLAVYSHSETLLNSFADLYPAGPNPDFSALDPEARPYILRARLYQEEKSTYPVLLTAYRQVSDPDLLADLRSALARPRLPENIKTAFSLLKNPEILKPQDHLSFLLRLRSWPATRKQALSWVFENWDYIVKICGEKSLEDYPRYLASSIDKKEDADAFFSFFSTFADNPVLARALKVARSDISASLSLLDLDRPAVLKAVEKL